MIWHRFQSRLRHTLRSEDGNMLVLGGFLLLGVLGFGGVALDFGQMVELRRKLQVAADVAAHEHVGGKAQPELQVLCRASVEDCTVEVKSSLPDVSILACAPYQPLLGPVYVSLGVTYAGLRVENGRLQLCAASEARGGVCTPAEEEKQEEIACPSGQIGTPGERHFKRTAYTCPAGATPPSENEWELIGETAAVCVPDTPKPPQCKDDTRKPQYRWSESRFDTSEGRQAKNGCFPGNDYGARYVRVEQVRWPSCDDNNDEGWTDWEDVKPQVRHPEVSDSCNSACFDGRQEIWEIIITKNEWEKVSCPSTNEKVQQSYFSKTQLHYQKGTCQSGPSKYTNQGGSQTNMMISLCPRGGKAFTSPGTYTWTVPENVKSVSMVTVGGGASGSTSGSAPDTFRFSPGEASSITGSRASLSARGAGYSAPKVADGEYKKPVNVGGCGSGQPGECGGMGGGRLNPWRSENIGGGGGGAGGYRTWGTTVSNDGPGNGSIQANNSEQPRGGDNRGAGGGMYRSIIGGGGGGVSIYGGVASYDAGGGHRVINGIAGSAGSPGGGGGSNGKNGDAGCASISECQLETSSGGGERGKGGDYGGGGGGLLAHTDTMSWDLSYGGGGGELTYKNDVTVVPGEKITVVVGKGGAAPPSVKRDIGGKTLYLQPGSGAQGAARVMWGDGCRSGARKFPNDNATRDPFAACRKDWLCADGSSNIQGFCTWEED